MADLRLVMNVLPAHSAALTSRLTRVLKRRSASPDTHNSHYV
jgi:hypothetical protein